MLILNTSPCGTYPLAMYFLFLEVNTEKIGDGGGSEVFEWKNDNLVVKLAKPNTSKEAILTEFHQSRLAWENGLPVPEPFEIVNVDGRSGIVFERIYGETIMTRFLRTAMDQLLHQDKMNDSEVSGDDRIAACVLYEIHSRFIPGMHNQRDNLKRDILWGQYLTEQEKEDVITHLEQLPLKHQLCHGDPNPGNFIIQDNKVVILDWMNASIGNPEADLAEYVIMIRYAVFPVDVPKEVTLFLDNYREVIIDNFISEYHQLSGISYDEVDAWILPIAARKLASGVSDEEKCILVNEIRRRLQ